MINGVILGFLATFLNYIFLRQSLTRIYLVSIFAWSIGIIILISSLNISFLFSDLVVCIGIFIICFYGLSINTEYLLFIELFTYVMCKIVGTLSEIIVLQIGLVRNYTTVTMIVLCLLLHLLLSKLNLYLSEKINESYLTVITNISFVFTLAISFLLYDSTFYSSTYLFVTIISALYIVVLAYINQLNTSDHLLLHNVILQQQQQLNELSFKNAKQIQKINHDLKHTLYFIKNALDNNDPSKALNYINQLTSSYSEYAMPYKSKDKIIECALNQSFIKEGYNRLNISVVEDYEFLPDIDDLDLYRLLVNVFDNALIHGDSSFGVKISFKQTETIFTVRVTNKTTSNEIVLNKPDHYGLSNIKDCVDKYKGRMDVDITDFFTITIAFPYAV